MGHPDQDIATKTIDKL